MLEILKPADCAIGFGIPLSENNFIKDIDCGTKDYANGQFTGISQFNDRIVSVASFIVPEYKKLGALVIQELDYLSLKQLFNSSNIRVIILFTHFLESKRIIELRDAMYNVNDIANLIPCHYDKVVDLCACSSASLGRTIKQTAPNSTVQLGFNQKDPVFWMYFYLAFFKMISESNFNYWQGMEELTQKYLTLNK